MLNWLNGKKTVIGAILHYAAVGLAAAGKTTAAHVVDVISNIVMGVGLAHRAAKAAGVADGPTE